MPVFELNRSLVFPHPSLANPDGLLAVGGDLSVDRLLLAYSNGIFPWFGPDDPILWWSPDPRMVLFPSRFKASKSLRAAVASGRFEVRINSCFKQVILQCGRVERKGQEESWITPQMEKAYTKLHLAGHAHSFETFLNGTLVGGLYGVRIGKVFSGESMFHLVSDASKVAFVLLVNWCLTEGITLIDAQQNTPHLASLGATEISREAFLTFLK
jgi:leucyl/phenylalanyl-tRNA---protein transferase